jgi:eukaryotic-like serine/threonine-protein kinase
VAEPPGRTSDDGFVWERWDEVDGLFEAALDLPLEERDAFLVQASHGDVELQRVLRELLASTDAAGAQLTAPGDELVRAAMSRAAGAAPPPLEPGERVGPYCVGAELGRGGMATVYEAERADGSFQRRVALKVLRRGIDTDDVVRRFLAERQILSGLTHPNIARLLDGGATDDGRPWLVMDLVDGEPITDYADRCRLTVRDRLRLFLQVTEAVQYAHQRLVVHRDLKPSNILVTTEGQVKLLDFGIAKLLGADADDAPLTRVGVHPLTPQYASPEQLRGDPITTASDVYQLGVLLHVLLTGARPPLAEPAADESAAAVPGRPSDLVRQAGRRATQTKTAARDPTTVAKARAATPDGLRRALRGDLDVIMLHALDPAPERRYDTVRSLAADVRQHLDGRPIAARAPSTWYRLGKFMRRRPLVVPTTGVLLVALLGFGSTRYRYGVQLEHERNEAQLQAARAEQLKDFMVGVFGSADPYTPADPERSRSITVVEALEHGVRRARTELADRPRLRADLLSSIATVYESLDQRTPARALIAEVLELRQRSGDTMTAEYADEVGRGAALLGLLGQMDSADALHRQRLELVRRIHGPGHPLMAHALIAYSSHVFTAGRLEQTFELREDAIRILRSAHQPPLDVLGEALGLLSSSYRDLQRLADADSAARESLAVYRELYGDEHPSTAIARVRSAQVAHERGDYAGAARLYREALPVLERTLGPDHRNTHASWNNLGTVLMEAEDYAGAEQVHRRILEMRRRLSGGDDDPEVAGSLQNLAAALLRQHRFAEAESLSLRAAGIYGRVTPAGHYLRAFPLMSITESRLLQRDGRGAEETALRALRILRGALPVGHYATAAAECRVGAALALQGRLVAAEPLVTAALAAMQSNEQTPERLVRECADANAALRAPDHGG